jgi:hypothetical protein
MAPAVLPAQAETLRPEPQKRETGFPPVRFML